MSAREVRDRLADRFRLLKGPEPGPDRQQTLRHAVGWSYDLLTDDERDLLRITSVFAGGFDLASIFAAVTIRSHQARHVQTLPSRPCLVRTIRCLHRARRVMI